MKNNEYFVPDIEDLRVGYELEAEELNKPDNNSDDPDGKWWKKVKIKIAQFENEDDPFDPTTISGIYQREIVYVRTTYRTPYLTKEQIEVEGWVSATSSPNRHYTRTATFIRVWNDTRSHDGEFLDSEGNVIFSGEIKSINEFRYICKLLKI